MLPRGNGYWERIVMMLMLFFTNIQSCCLESGYCASSLVTGSDSPEFQDGGFMPCTTELWPFLIRSMQLWHLVHSRLQTLVLCGCAVGPYLLFGLAHIDFFQNIILCAETSLYFSDPPLGVHNIWNEPYSFISDQFIFILDRSISTDIFSFLFRPSYAPMKRWTAELTAVYVEISSAPWTLSISRESFPRTSNEHRRTPARSD